MQSLNKTIVEAGQLCGRTKLDVDIYKVGSLFQAKLTHLRRSKNFEIRAHHERSKITFRDSKGKTVKTIELAKKESPKKEAPKKEQKEIKDTK